MYDLFAGMKFGCIILTVRRGGGLGGRETQANAAARAGWRQSSEKKSGMNHDCVLQHVNEASQIRELWPAASGLLYHLSFARPVPLPHSQI